MQWLKLLIENPDMGCDGFHVRAHQSSTGATRTRYRKKREWT